LGLKVDGVENSVLTLIYPKAFASRDCRITISFQFLAVVRAGILRELEDAEGHLPKNLGFEAR